VQGEYTVGAQGTETMLNSLMYRTSYYDFGKVRDWEAGVGQLQGSQVVAGSFNARDGGTNRARLLQHWTHAAHVLLHPPIMLHMCCCTPHHANINAREVPHHAHSVLVADARKATQRFDKNAMSAYLTFLHPTGLPLAPCTYTALRIY
jgi:hypothetical protein